MSTQRPIVLKGKLKFKGDGSGKKTSERMSVSSDVNGNSSSSNSKKRAVEVASDDKISISSSKDTNRATEILDDEDEFLTESQRKHRRRKMELESRDARALVKSSYRERVEDFNNRLASLTEHNDIPRISAAGNG